jgi:hypothetical protein
MTAREKKAEYNKQYYRANRAEIRQQQAGYYVEHKPAMLKRAKRRHKANPTPYEQKRDQSLRRDYGITLLQYQDMLTRQRNGCAVCHQPETRTYRGKPRPLSVDHDHATGAVRALLCDSCNVALGLVAESAERLRALADYIEIHAQRKRKAA